MRFVPLIAALLAFGCIHRDAQIDQAMTSWMRHDVHDLISAWGPPSRVVPNGRTDLYEWVWTGPTRSIAVRVTEDIVTSKADTASCRQWFDVNRDGRITGWHWRGEC
jgi:hypothetical protein